MPQSTLQCKVCPDWTRARGNLTLLFATELTASEIVPGKLAARLVSGLGPIACAALAPATLFGDDLPVLRTALGDVGGMAASNPSRGRIFT